MALAAFGNADCDVDILVVGGGINGCGIARDAAGRGLRVLLCEQDDLGAHTSSASTKLIHGGLRYIEQYDFALVRKALIEREVLINAAPHIIWPLRFVMPHDSHLRAAWMIRVGLFIYDHLARRRRLAGSSSIDLRRHPAGLPLAERLQKGFIYSDAWVEDSRLVVLNALDAAERGAEVHPRTRFESVTRHADHWLARLTRTTRNTAIADGSDQRSNVEVRARALVNAAGPWVGRVLDTATQAESQRPVRLVKGSHIVVKRLFEHEFAYIFQNPDRRIIFAIPYESSYTLIGTTDIDYEGDPARVVIDTAEVNYLCEMASRYFRKPIEPNDVVASYSGVRPLHDDESSDPSSVTRDYSLEFDTSAAPLLSVFGGKLTTYRRLAEQAMDRLAPLLGCAGVAWTRSAFLPGGDMPDADFERFVAQLAQSHPWLPPTLCRRYARAYGTRVDAVLGAATELAHLGEQIAPGLYSAEVDYLRRVEFAETTEDILWRRSKLALHLPDGGHAALARWLAAHPVSTPH